MWRPKSIGSMNTHELSKELERVKRLDGDTHFNLNNYKEYKISLRGDENMARGLFWPDPLNPHGHVAHPATIAAMRKDIFVGHLELDELAETYTCEGCQKELDLQFWLFCPYCETPFRLQGK